LSIVDELLFGGDENRLLTLATSIDTDRFDVRVVTLKRPNAELDAYYGSMRQHYAAAGVHVRSLGEGHPNYGLAPDSALRQARRAKMFSRALAGACRIVRDERIDIIDGHGGPGNLIAVAAGVACGRRRIVTTYNVEQWQPRWLWQLVHQATLGLADVIVTDSYAVACAIRRFMITRGRIEVIPNGVVPPRSERTNEEMRALFDLPQDPNIRIVGQISSLFPTKGHMVLIEAARTVLETNPDTAFLLVGYPRNDPTYRDRLQQRARELGIGERVRVVSYPGPIGDVWNVIDIQAHPTLLDSLPNAIIEGMSLRKPAVVTDVGGIATLIDHGRTGLIVPPGDAGSLSAAILRLLDDEPYARQLADSARNRYEQSYTPRHMAENLQRVFLDLAA
jgi:glycosyltransferase involved in cell wall biosynthesis